ncbi:MAG: hypothetical protein K0R62_4004 [Nonomuraea muscovyensis]|nr:hypothetical protein [Nonomuraea muscovyensis]
MAEQRRALLVGELVEGGHVVGLPHPPSVTHCDTSATLCYEDCGTVRSPTDSKGMP